MIMLPLTLCPVDAQSDEDTLWQPNYRESKEEIRRRGLEFMQASAAGAAAAACRWPAFSTTRASSAARPVCLCSGSCDDLRLTSRWWPTAASSGTWLPTLGELGSAGGCAMALGAACFGFLPLVSRPNSPLYAVCPPAVTTQAPRSRESCTDGASAALAVLLPLHGRLWDRFSCFTLPQTLRQVGER